MSSRESSPTDLADRVLDRYRTFAVVGASPSRSRPSHRVMKTLIDHGYRVIAINPNATEACGLECYPSLYDIPDDVTVDVVDIFRRSDAAGVHVDEAIDIGAKAVWFQLGVSDTDAATRAREAGLDVVTDRCPAIELSRRAA